MSLVSGIDSLFNKINCDKTAIVEMLGGSAGVTDTNMTQVSDGVATFYSEFEHLSNVKGSL